MNFLYVENLLQNFANNCLQECAAQCLDFFLPANVGILHH